MPDEALMDETSEDLGVPLGTAAEAERLRTIVEANFRAVWCFLRRLGLSAADADDAAQDVMMVVARRLSAITVGAERAFMFGTAYHMAAKARHAMGRNAGDAQQRLELQADPAPGPEVVADQRRARDVLDEVLDALPLDLRAVLVLAEIDELAVPQIATLLGLPSGTVASRLRRARELFDAHLARWMARQRFRGGA